MLINGQLTLEAANAFAKRVAKEGVQEPGQQLRSAFKLALQRLPQEAEFAARKQLLQKRSLVELCRVLLNLNDFAYLD